MVLNELGSKITAALAKVQNAEVIDDALLDACLKDISTALLQADVNVKQVCQIYLSNRLFCSFRLQHWQFDLFNICQPPHAGQWVIHVYPPSPPPSSLSHGMRSAAVS